MITFIILNIIKSIYCLLFDFAFLKHRNDINIVSLYPTIDINSYV